MRHGRNGEFCCRISVALEGNYFLVDGNGLMDCFPTFDAAFSAGTRALFTIINKRIVLPKKTAPKASELVPKLCEEGSDEIVVGFFGGYD